MWEAGMEDGPFGYDSADFLETSLVPTLKAAGMQSVTRCTPRSHPITIPLCAQAYNRTITP